MATLTTLYTVIWRKPNGVCAVSLPKANYREADITYHLCCAKHPRQRFGIQIHELLPFGIVLFKSQQN